MKNKLRHIGNLKHSKLDYSHYFTRKALRRFRSDKIFKKLRKYEQMLSFQDGEIGTVHSFRYIPILPEELQGVNHDEHDS